MIRIIICDDDHFTIQLASTLLEKAIKMSQTDSKIVCKALSGIEVLNYIQKISGPYLYFLDFDLGKQELNGIDLVKKIYQQDPEGKVVFVTSHTEKGIEILKSGIQAFGFIEKNPDEHLMLLEYIKYLKMMDSSFYQLPDTSMIELQIGIDEVIRLSTLDIAYVDSVKTIAHSICYHTFDGSEVIVRDTIEHALALLGDHFIRCHRSVIINKNYVVSIKDGLIKLSNGTVVSCALRKRKEIMQLCCLKETSND